MDSIKLLSDTAGKFGERCRVTVSAGDTYEGVYCGYCDSTKEAPLTLRLGVTEQEAKRIGVPWMRMVGIPYDVITLIQF